MVFRLNKRIEFPDPRLGDADGLFAVGGDLSVDRLILAYSNGIFPWFAFREGTIQWWCPMDRFVIFPSEIHVSHSMRTLMNKGEYRLSINRAFEDVIKQCGKLREEEEESRLRSQRRGVGQRKQSGRRTIWSNIRPLFLWRKHVFVSSKRIEIGLDRLGADNGVQRRRNDRLPVRDSAP